MSGTRVVVRALAIFWLAVLSTAGGIGQDQQPQGIREKIPDTTVIWRNPGDIASRNLFYGPGGEGDAPPDRFTFVKEDLDGTNTKLDVRDAAGTNWKVKLGSEVQSEVVATRLVWAVGYFADEDYFVRESTVSEMPRHLHRGQNFIRPNGVLYDARLEREREGAKKEGSWRWKDNVFNGTREFNGLRVMMALINNWDLKDVNNSVIKEKSPSSFDQEQLDDGTSIYFISDLGASFGSTGFSWPHSKSRGNLKAYSHSKFISKITADYVDFNVPTRPALLRAIDFPDFIRRLRMRWIGKHIPRADARWIGGLLAQLSPGQIRDAFKAAGYSPDDVEGYARVVEERITELNKL